jgi:integrase
MAMKCLMSWIKSRKGWMKEYKGKKYTISCRQLGTPESKEASYQAANAWWTARKAQIDAAYRGVARQPLPLEDVVRATGADFYEDDDKARAAAGYATPQEEREAIEWFADRHREMGIRVEVMPRPERIPTEEERQQILREAHEQAVIAFVRQYLLGGGALPPEVVENLPPARLAALEALRGGQASPDRTVEAHATAWLQRQELRVAAKEISPGGYDNKKRWLGRFLDFVGRAADVATITDSLLEAFDTHCLQKRVAYTEGKKDGWSDFQTRDIRAVAREWVCWLAEHNTISRPAWTMHKGRKFRLVPRQIKPWTVAEFQAVLDATNRDQAKLILLLGANCGFTQKDCTDLRPEEVDWKAGYIERRRSKSSHVKNAPVVRYKLWPPALALLFKVRGDGDRVITTIRGSAYVREGFKNGRRVRCDSFWSYFKLAKRRVQKVMPDFKGSPKGVRKMAATLLGSHPAHGRYVQHFLGHSPGSIADRHYARIDQAAFDEAVTWLGRQLGQVT